MQSLTDKRDRIVQAAIGVFGSVGYDAASMADIAARAAVAKGTLYLYFASKEQLFEEAYQLCQEERFKACGVGTETQLSVLERLCRRLRRGIAWELAEPEKNRLLRAYLTHPVFRGKVPRVVSALNMQALEPLFMQGIAQRELRPLPPELLVGMFTHFGSAVYYYIEKHPEDAENDELWAQILKSLRACLGAEN